MLEAWVGATPYLWMLIQCQDSIRRIITAGITHNTTASYTSNGLISLLLRDHGIDMLSLLQSEPS